jgi:hypothetical protein
VFSTGQGRNGPGLEAANSRHLNQPYKND